MTAFLYPGRYIRLRVLLVDVVAELDPAADGLREPARGHTDKGAEHLREVSEIAEPALDRRRERRHSLGDHLSRARDADRHMVLMYGLTHHALEVEIQLLPADEELLRDNVRRELFGEMVLDIFCDAEYVFDFCR